MQSINIVIPMAGAGSRFVNQGYTVAKPFIEIDGLMMIERVLEGLKYEGASYTLILQKSFLVEYAELLEKLSSRFSVDFITVDKLTAGASCTALAAHKLINDDTPVLFADSDNIFAEGVIRKFVDDALARKLDGSLLTFETSESCFSFVETNEEGLALRTAEKDPISKHAITGAYFFSKGEDFVAQAINMMIYNDKAQGEFYMSGVYNWLIRDQKKIGIFGIQDSHWDCVGTPEQLGEYLSERS